MAAHDKAEDPASALDPWLVGLAAVRFDTDAGQTVDFVVPEGALTPEETKAVGFHAFPVRCMCVCV